jgi:ribosomal protein S18 acetylase RimI-like enzyme
VADFRIARLRADHARDGFRCGVDALDTFLRRFARQNDAKGLSRTFVATRAGAREVLGYVTVRAGEVACLDLPPDARKGLPRYPVPILHIARLAVDERARGQGLGERLLTHALQRAHRAAERVGMWGVEVVAKDDAARAFYERYGFRALIDDRLHLYLPLATVRKAFG